MRDDIRQALTASMREGDRTRTATLRLINAAIKDRDIEARSHGKDAVSDDEIAAILSKMIKQRQESSRIYEENGRCELAEQEREEIAVIREFLPRQLDESEIESACRKVVDDVGASGLRDMGRCMGTLKTRYPGQMDFGKASATVKSILK